MASISDNKNPKIKIKIIGTGEGSHEEVHGQGSLLGLRQGEDREGGRFSALATASRRLRRHISRLSQRGSEKKKRHGGIPSCASFFAGKGRIAGKEKTMDARAHLLELMV